MEGRRPEVYFRATARRPHDGLELGLREGSRTADDTQVVLGAAQPEMQIQFSRTFPPPRALDFTLG